MNEKTIRKTSVIGRFAPSPTGPLHFGSLIAALGSFLLAKSSGGRWLLRIEDLDLPRVAPGAIEAQLRDLENLGLTWDAEVVYQSRRVERYLEVLEDLKRRGLSYPCSCSRREIIASAPHLGEEGPVYPGTCRSGPAGTRKSWATRLKVPDREISFCDGVLGRQAQNLAKDVGDFILHRADGVFAYQLAVVVDDLDAGVNQVVRGADLLGSSARQVYLWELLGRTAPEYYHLPMVLGPDGDKLSKRHGGPAISSGSASTLLFSALSFLGQAPAGELKNAAPEELLAWGVENFRVGQVPVLPGILPQIEATDNSPPFLS